MLPPVEPSEAESRYELLASCVGAIVFVTEPGGRMLFANDALLRETGYTVADFQFPQDQNPFLHPDDAARVGAFIAAFAAGDALVSEPIDNRFFDRWGQEQWCRSVLAKVRYGGAQALQFVTRRLDEEGIAAPHSAAVMDYHVLVEGAGDGIARIDGEGRILFGNRRFLELVGRDAVSLGHQPIGALLHPDETAMAPRFLSPGRFETRLSTPAGDVVWVDVNVAPLASAADRLAIMRDVTEKRRLEQERRHQQKLESLGLLAGGVAHDFNNVLMVVQSNASLAASRARTGRDVEPFLDEILHACDRAAGLCRQMLAYAGRSQITWMRFDLGQFVDDLARLVRAGVPESAELELALASPAPHVEGDVDALRPVLMNLVTNAAEALGGAPGHIRVEVGSQSVDRAYLRAAEMGAALAAGEYAFVRVTDTGAGMDDETRGRMFDPFFTTKPSGHGLGLSSALGVVRSHRGAIHVDTERGRGTAITVLLPPSTATPLPAPARRREAELRGTGTILVADDQDGVRNALAALLEEHGFTVVAVADGEAAVAECMARRTEILLALLDVIMPRLGGVEAGRRIRAAWPGLPIVLMSGYTAGLPLLAGAEILAKPFRPDALFAVLQRLLPPGSFVMQ